MCLTGWEGGERMALPDNLSELINETMKRLAGQKDADGSKHSGNTGSNKLSITPSQALVIAGLLSGTLQVDSVLVDRNQLVQIILVGSLKRKTDLEKMLDQIGSMSFDEVLKAMLGRV
jgi:hypothetical protein